MSVTLLMDEEKFALQGQDEPGVPVPYGEVANIELSGRRYIAFCDDAETPEVYDVTDRRTLRAASFTTEEVELEIEDDEDDTEEDEESEDAE